MSIKVTCTECGATHQVKNKYGGKRGKCPLCDAWMLIPAAPADITVFSDPPAPAPAPRRQAPVPDLGETVALSREEDAPRDAGRAPERRSAKARAADPDATFVDEEAPAAVVDEAPPPPRKKKKRDEDEDAIEAAEVVEEGPTPKQDAGKRFGWFTALLFLLATLGIAAVAAATFLSMPSRTFTGALSRSTAANSPTMQARPFINEGLEQIMVAAGVVLVAVLLLSGWLALVLSRDFRGFPRLMSYLGLLVALAGLTLAMTRIGPAMDRLKNIEQQSRVLVNQQPTLAGGDVVTDVGLAVWLTLGALGGAAVLFVLTTLLMHQKWSMRLLSLVLMLVMVGVCGTFLLTSEDALPRSVRELLPF